MTEISNKTLLKNNLKVFNKHNKDKIKITFGSPYGKNKYLFLDEHEHSYKPKVYFNTYTEALTALTFLELYLTVKDHKHDSKKVRVKNV